MNLMNVKLSSLVLFVALAGCSSVGPVEEYEQKSVPEGPGLFTGSDGAISLGELLTGSNGENSKVYGTGYNVDIPAIDQKSFEDFENFKAWRRAQEPGSENYQEYQDWRAYQQYLRFKAQKEGGASISQ